MEGHSARIHLIWVKSQSSLFSPLSLNILREVSLYLPILLPLVWVDSQTLYILDFDSLKLGPAVPLHREITTLNASWLAVDSSRIFICEGGRNGTYYIDSVLRTALFLYIDGTVEDLSSMHFEHNNPGLIVYRSAIHVFGSFAGSGQSKCERFSMTKSSPWEQLPDMRRRRTLFTPVLWQSCVYLCGGNNDSIECFDGVEMRLLGVTFPDRGTTLACMRNDSVLILATHFTLELSRERSDTDPKLTEIKRETHSCQVYSFPVIYKDLVLNLAQKQVVAYSVSDGHTVNIEAYLRQKLTH